MLGRLVSFDGRHRCGGHGRLDHFFLFDWPSKVIDTRHRCEWIRHKPRRCFLGSHHDLQCRQGRLRMRLRARWPVPLRSPRLQAALVEKGPNVDRRGRRVPKVACTSQRKTLWSGKLGTLWEHVSDSRFRFRLRYIRVLPCCQFTENLVETCVPIAAGSRFFSHRMPVWGTYYRDRGRNCAAAVCISSSRPSERRARPRY